MNSSDEAPKLNPWPFIAADVVLLGIVYALAIRAPGPLLGLPLVAVIVCGLGAVLTTVPFIINATRRQDAALADRQDQIAALAQTTSASAEQLSIAVASLHTIADAASKNIRSVEQLPQRMQDKINDFKSQINEVAVTDNEALSQEVNALRSAETERLESVLEAIRKTTQQLSTLETSSRKQVAEIADSLARISSQSTEAGHAQVASVVQAKADAERAIAEAHRAAAASLEKTVASALAQIETKLSTLQGNFSAQLQELSANVDAKFADLAASSISALSAGPVSADSPAAEDVISAPSTPHFASRSETVPPAETKAASAAPRKRPVRKPSEPDELGLGLERAPSEEEMAAGPTSAAPAPSADGATRLLVTAYIGIGNKLFARGEGPGLKPNQGFPLQFISIGKWRWETSDTSLPVNLRLYKNDEVECTALGTVTLEPGYQQEVTANF